METSKDADARARKLTIGGAIVAALAASSCCLGPILLAALGVGGAGAFAGIGAYRPYILAGTAALLAAGFYLSYRKPKAASGDACGCARPNKAASRVGRIGLWVAAIFVVSFAASPTLLARFGRTAALPVAAGVKVETATIGVQGIDCEACATPLRKAMTAVGGFHDLRLDIPAQNVHVTYEPAPGRLEAYARAIEDATGYEVSLAPNASTAAERRN